MRYPRSLPWPRGPLAAPGLVILNSLGGLWEMATARRQLTEQVWEYLHAEIVVKRRDPALPLRHGKVVLRLEPLSERLGVDTFAVTVSNLKSGRARLYYFTIAGADESSIKLA